MNKYVWVPAKPKDEEPDLFESGVILAGCVMTMLIMLVVAWVFS